MQSKAACFGKNHVVQLPIMVNRKIFPASKNIGQGELPPHARQRPLNAIIYSLALVDLFDQIATLVVRTMPYVRHPT